MKPPPAAQQLDQSLDEKQLAVISAPLSSMIHLKGNAGTGKTTSAVQRLSYLVESGVDGGSILILVPQRILAFPYSRKIHSPRFPAGGQPSVLTYGGLAQRMISLFWPLIAYESGFKNPALPPRFLSLETAQYYLAMVVEPLIQSGYFESLTVDPNRLYSQILDNMNKSSIVGFTVEEIANRLRNAWTGKPSQNVIYDQAQDCALRFREFCLQTNLLDFSLQLEVFHKHIWPSLLCKQYLEKTFKHLIYDNIEEDFPVAHDLIAEWLPGFSSALLIQDSGGGFRSFLGADPFSASKLGSLCQGSIEFFQSKVQSSSLTQLENTLNQSLIHHKITGQVPLNTGDSFSILTFKYYPEALECIAGQVASLVNEKGIAPQNIALLTPFLSDALRFSFTYQLEKVKVPFSTYRPSRSLRDEPAVRAILCLARLAYAGRIPPPSRQEIRLALMLLINGCDLVRSDLLAQTLYTPNNPIQSLGPFSALIPDMQSRITYTVGERYEQLREWLSNNQILEDETLDSFFSRLFGELLSQSGFGFHDDLDAASSISRLIDSCRRFRQTTGGTLSNSWVAQGLEFIRVLSQGILEAQSLTSRVEQYMEDAVFLGPAHSFLMNNRPVKYQYWIDIGSQGWWSRLDQPLTQPYVLSRNWLDGRKWTDTDEYEHNQATLARVATGLLRRCSEHVFLCAIGVNEQGMEERGALMVAIQTILRSLHRSKEEQVV